MPEQPIPNFYIHNFDSPQLFNMPIVDYVCAWQLESLDGDAVTVGGFHGYCGFFSDFMITWVHDGEASAKFNGFTTIGGQLVATFTLRIIATSGVMGAQLMRLSE